MAEKGFEMRIPSSLIKAAALCTSRDITRFQLTGIHVTRAAGGIARVESTDGKSLYRASYRHEDVQGWMDTRQPTGTFEAILPMSKELLELAKSAGGKTIPEAANIRIDELKSNGYIPMYSRSPETEKSLSPKAIDGSFPDVQVAFKDRSEALVQVRINPLLMIRACQAIIDSGCAGTIREKGKDIPASPDCVMTIFDAEHPIELDAQGKTMDGTEVAVSALVMPLVIKK